MQEDTLHDEIKRKNLIALLEKMLKGEISYKHEEIKDIANMTLEQQMRTLPSDMVKMMKGEMSYSDMRLRYG